MNDLIHKKPLLKWLRDYQFENFAEVGNEREYNFIDNLVKGIENEPVIEAAPIKHGKWTLVAFNRGIKICQCSVCNKRTYGSLEYCGRCGAKMDL